MSLETGGMSSFAAHLLSVTNRRLLQSQPSAANVSNAAAVLVDFAALQPSAASASDAGISELLHNCGQLLTAKQDAALQAGCELVRAIASACSAQLFVQHHAAWMQQLLSALQRPRLSDDAWHVCTLALQALVARQAALLDAAGVRRDAAASAVKLLQLLLPAFSPDALPTRQADALLVLQALLTGLPHSLRTHAAALEGAVAGLLVSPGTAQPLRMTAAAVFASLPRVAGTSDAWSAAAQQLLWSAHAMMDAAFAGLEAEGATANAKASLEPRAADSALVAAVLAEAATSEAAAPQWLGTLNALLASLTQLMSASFPTAVLLPVAGTAQLLARVTSLADNAELDAGHSAHSLAKAVDQLRAAHAIQPPAYAAFSTLLRALGPALLPHLRSLCDVVSQPLRRVAASDQPYWRAELALYGAAKELVRRGGPAAARWLAAPVVDAALWRLYGISTLSAPREACTDVAAPLPSKKLRKRKGRGAQADAEPQAQYRGSPLAGTRLARTNVQLDCEVLSLLQALLTSAAALLPTSLRLKADAMVAHFALATATAAASARASISSEPADGLAMLQLAAYRALLASVLAPVGHRPPFLAQALDLFRGGLHAQHTPLCGFCHEALLCCEALLHPRAIPTPIPLDPDTAPLTYGKHVSFRSNASGMGARDLPAAAAEEESEEDMEYENAAEAPAPNGMPVAASPAIASLPAAEPSLSPVSHALEPAKQTSNVDAVAAAAGAAKAAAAESLAGERACAAPELAVASTHGLHVGDEASAQVAQPPAATWRSEPPAIALRPLENAATGPKVLCDHFASDDDSEGPLPDIDSGASGSEGE